jgi:phosphoribosyl-ATP pyrophosphohydrolase
MGFVQLGRPDIFVSYARVNDRPTEPEREGWVTALVAGLKNLLAMKLGRDDAFEVWMDHQLAGNAALTPEISDRLRDTSVFLLILSNGYVASEWCRREMALFHEEIRRRRSTGSRVFVVEFDPVARPPELADLLGYRFWVDDRPGKAPRTLGYPRLRDGDDRYFDLLNDLCHDLVAELRRLKDAPPDAAGAPADLGRPAVYLAEATDDLGGGSSPRRSSRATTPPTAGRPRPT